MLIYFYSQKKKNIYTYLEQAKFIWCINFRFIIIFFFCELINYFVAKNFCVIR